MKSDLSDGGTMDIEAEVRALADAASKFKAEGRFGHNPTEADIHSQLGLLWEAVLLLARRPDDQQHG